MSLEACDWKVEVTDLVFFPLSCRATTILGYLPQELLGTSCYEYFHQDDLPHLAERHRKGRVCCQSSLKKTLSVNILPYLSKYTQEESSLSPCRILACWQVFPKLCVSSFRIYRIFSIEYRTVKKNKSKHISFWPSTVLRTKEKIETNCYKFKTKYGYFVTLQSQWFSFINPWTKEVEYIVSTNTVIS